MKIDPNPSVVDFFRTAIKTSLFDKRLNVDENTEFYIVNLLSQATQSSLENAEPNYFEQPLAILFGKALEAKTQLEQYALLKQLGDQSLFISGFFADSLNKSVIDIDYYISMGANAYDSLSDLSKKQSEKDFFAATFVELSTKFPQFVDIIAEISEKANITSDQDVLRMYERWMYTKSQRLLEKLQQLGIRPNKKTAENLN